MHKKGPDRSGPFSFRAIRSSVDCAFGGTADRFDIAACTLDGVAGGKQRCDQTCCEHDAERGVAVHGDHPSSSMTFLGCSGAWPGHLRDCMQPVAENSVGTIPGATG